MICCELLRGALLKLLPLPAPLLPEAVGEAEGESALLLLLPAPSKLLTVELSVALGVALGVVLVLGDVVLAAPGAAVTELEAVLQGEAVAVGE